MQKHDDAPSTKNVFIRERVITQDQIGSFEDLGLGRGVDATNPTPWLNKKAFQVRQVTFDNIIGTEEGNLYQGFVNEVESTEHFQTNLSASVPVSQLVGIGIDSELSRSYSVSQKSVGRKIITRTISFRADFDEIGKKIEGTTNGQSKPLEKTFEVCLKDWIKRQEEEETEKNKLEGATETKPKLTEYDHCYNFISTFSITHYVHSLELGASHYRVVSQEEYATQLSSKAKLGVGQMADFAIGNEKSFRSSKYKSQTTKVGRMQLVKDYDAKQSGSSKGSDDTNEGDDSKGSKGVIEEVKRGTVEEAVVGVKLQPISALVKDVGLRIELQKALQQYIRNKQKIKCKKYSTCMPITHCTHILPHTNT